MSLPARCVEYLYGGVETSTPTEIGTGFLRRVHDIIISCDAFDGVLRFLGVVVRAPSEIRKCFTLRRRRVRVSAGYPLKNGVIL